MPKQITVRGETSPSISFIPFTVGIYYRSVIARRYNLKKYEVLSLLQNFFEVRGFLGRTCFCLKLEHLYDKLHGRMPSLLFFFLAQVNTSFTPFS